MQFFVPLLPRVSSPSVVISGARLLSKLRVSVSLVFGKEMIDEAFTYPLATLHPPFHGFEIECTLVLSEFDMISGTHIISLSHLYAKNTM